MMRHRDQCRARFAGASLLCGLLYPLALTGLGQWIMPFQANGSLERRPDGTVIGSRLIGQQWNGPQWFHGRPSATDRRGSRRSEQNSARALQCGELRPARIWARPASACWSA